MTGLACAELEKYTYEKYRCDFAKWLCKERYRRKFESQYKAVWERTNEDAKALFGFAAWAAFRGATAGSVPKGFKTEKAPCILEATGFFDLAKKGAEWLPCPEKFDREHGDWCKKVRAEAKRLGIKTEPDSENDDKYLSYGRSAKLINVFLKVVMLCKHDTLPDGKEKAKWYAVHPPIDRGVLEGMRDACFGCWYKDIWIDLPGTNGKPCNTPSWKKFQCNDYKNVIKMICRNLYECGYEDPLPLWRNEWFFNSNR